MAAVHKYRNDDGDLEVVDNVLRWGWSSQEQAEEGSAAAIELYVDDPDNELDFVTWRRWVIYESTSEDDNEIFFSGFITAFKISHSGSDILNPTGRVWTISIADMNNLWDRRVMVGSDVDRPAETDVERMQWLVESEEMGYFDDLTLLSTASPVDLDARDVRGNTTKQVADECAQDSGKNYWIGTTGTIGGIGTDNFVWYGKSTLLTYVSPLSLSNDPLALDMPDVDAGTATTYPLGSDTVLDRTGDRIYDGNYVEYDGGAVFVKKPSTTVYFQLSGRDITTPAPEIKSAARAKRRALRQLNDLDTMLDRITTSPEIPASKATMIRAGMLIEISATHLPGWEDVRSCRILSAQHEPIYGGSWYRVTIVAEPVGGGIADKWFQIYQGAGGGTNQVGFDGLTINGERIDQVEDMVQNDWPKVAGEWMYFERTGGNGWNFGQEISGCGLNGSYVFPIGADVGNIILIGPFATGDEVTVHTCNSGATYPSFADARYAVRRFYPAFGSPGIPSAPGGTPGDVIATNVLAGVDTSWEVEA